MIFFKRIYRTRAGPNTNIASPIMCIHGLWPIHLSANGALCRLHFSRTRRGCGRDLEAVRRGTWRVEVISLDVCSANKGRGFIEWEERVFVENMYSEGLEGVHSFDHARWERLHQLVCTTTVRGYIPLWRAYRLYPGGIAQFTPSTNKAGERKAQGMLLRPPPAVM